MLIGEEPDWKTDYACLVLDLTRQKRGMKLKYIDRGLAEVGSVILEPRQRGVLTFIKPSQKRRLLNLPLGIDNTLVSPDGAAISKGKPVPSIIDWSMVVDTNKDAMINADEFKAGCAAGWIAPAS